jgi:hypothetical protein
VFKDKEERVAGRVVDCAVDVDQDEQIADQEDHGKDTTEQIRSNHCCRHGTSGVLMYVISKGVAVWRNVVNDTYLDLFAHVGRSVATNACIDCTDLSYHQGQPHARPATAVGELGEDD